MVINFTVSMSDIEVTCSKGHILEHRFESILFETGQPVVRQIHFSKTVISYLIIRMNSFK